MGGNERDIDLVSARTTMAPPRIQSVDVVRLGSPGLSSQIVGSSWELTELPPSHARRVAFVLL